MELPALRAENLTKRYGRVLALDALDLEVRAGEKVALIAAIGAVPAVGAWSYTARDLHSGGTQRTPTVCVSGSTTATTRSRSRG